MSAEGASKDRADGMETELPVLDGLAPDGHPDPDEATRRLIEQVVKPRLNLGNTGPPGRAD